MNKISKSINPCDIGFNLAVVTDINPSLATPSVRDDINRSILEEANMSRIEDVMVLHSNYKALGVGYILGNVGMIENCMVCVMRYVALGHDLTANINLNVRICRTAVNLVFFNVVTSIKDIEDDSSESSHVGWNSRLCFRPVLTKAVETSTT